MNLSFSLQALGKDLSFMPPSVFALGLFVCCSQKVSGRLSWLHLCFMLEEDLGEILPVPSFLPSFLPCSDRIQIVRFCCSGKEEIAHT
jgi:hypothetical protein